MDKSNVQHWHIPHCPRTSLRENWIWCVGRNEERSRKRLLLAAVNTLGCNLLCGCRICQTAAFLDSQLFDFFVVVLAVEDVPLLGALQDGAALALDFLTSG